MPVPIEISDSFTGTDGAAWNPAVWTTRNVAGASAAPTIHSNQGRMQTLPGSLVDCQVIAYLADSFTNLDMTVQYTATDADTWLGFPHIAYRVGSGLASGTPGNGYAVLINYSTTTATGAVQLWKLPIGGDFIAEVHDQPTKDNDPWLYRLRVKGARHLLKWWPAGDDEPPGWKIDATDATYTTGGVFLGVFNDNAHHTITVDWDDFHLLEVLPPDPGFRVASDPVTAMYVGADPVVTAWHDGVEIPVTWP